MTAFRKLVLSTVAVASLASAATPASARPWGYGGGYHGGWHHHGGGDVGGALVGGLIVGGLIGALVSSSDHGPAPRNVYRGPGPQDRAAGACAAAVEGDRGGRVSRITDVAPYADGWRVEGIVDPGEAGLRGYARPDSFACTVRYGRVDDVRYGSEYRPG